ncbi:MAG: hypothetical protein U5N55_13545 [Cypionkella sp.]|nr:hypothetical protein [Cypionkella sp.]
MGIKPTQGPARFLPQSTGDTARIIRACEKAFDDFAGAGTDRAANRKMLGLEG